MTSYKPSEHGETTSVAPLLQFFELVHIGDTMQSMVQVYFDKELVCLCLLLGSCAVVDVTYVAKAPHIDKTDFMNAVVREKKKFENGLDDSVAGGLNAGTDVLMNQVCSFTRLKAPPFKIMHTGRAYHPDSNKTT